MVHQTREFKHRYKDQLRLHLKACEIPMSDWKSVKAMDFEFDMHVFRYSLDMTP